MVSSHVVLLALQFSAGPRNHWRNVSEPCRNLSVCFRVAVFRGTWSPQASLRRAFRERESSTEKNTKHFRNLLDGGGGAMGRIRPDARGSWGGFSFHSSSSVSIFQRARVSQVGQHLLGVQFAHTRQRRGRDSLSTEVTTHERAGARTRCCAPDQSG